ncbi:MAG TPA: hypothetical protein H9816_06535 [Candidatus Tidjanibacter faecipullorum]|uniref:Tape measure protein N-terminal domain-containing protein n=1 Tax=Candidatus Tidjanibacter faecipullorum TaxID=2838766 RepID=A0A9D2DER8_9BACT|nr:hypothetical protein [Candidatus Tidjanibacter faecipullorum]
MLDLTAKIDTREATIKLQKLQEDARRAVSGMVTDYDRLDAAILKIGHTLKSVGAGISFASLVKQVAQTRGEFQQLEVAFETLLKSKEKADALMSEMVELAAKTPFDLKGVADGARRLLAYGFAAEDVTDILTRLGNVAAGLSLNLQDLAWLYGTTATQGRLYTKDLYQFQNRGIDIAGSLASIMGKTRDEISQMVEAGQIGFPEVQKAIEDMTNEGGRFYNLMQKQAGTITGLVSNLGDAFKVMFNNIGKSSEGVIAGTLKGAITLVENYESVIAVLGRLIALIGIYKTSQVVTMAVKRTTASVAYSEEAAILSELLDIKDENKEADIEAAAAKGTLTRAQAENLVALRKEAEARLQALQAEAGQAAADLATAERSNKVALERVSVAQQNLAIQEQELQRAWELGDAKAIEAQREAVLLAQQEKSAAASAAKVSADRLAEASVKAKTKAIEAETLQLKISQATTKSLTASQSFLTAAVRLSSKAFATLKATMASFLPAAVIMAVMELGRLLYKVATAETEAEAAAKRLADTQKQYDSEVQAEITTLDRLFDKLRAAKSGTDEYANAKKTIQDKYAPLLASMSDEVKSLDNVTAAQNRLKDAIMETAKARAADNAINEAIQTASDKKAGIIGDLREYIQKRRGDQAQAILDELVPKLNDDDFQGVVDVLNKYDINALNRGFGPLNKSIFQYFEVVRSLKTELQNIYTAFGQGGAANGGGSGNGGGADDQTQRITKLADVVDNLNKKSAELNRLRSQTEWTDAQIRKIDELREDLKELEKQYQNLTGKKWGVKSPDVSNLKVDILRIAKVPVKIDTSKIDLDALDLGDYLRVQMDSFNDYLQAYGDFQQKREAVTREYNQRIADAMAEGNTWLAEILKRQLSEALTDLDIENADSTIGRLFQDIGDRSLSELRAMAAEAENALSFITSGEWDEEKGLQFGISKETFDNLQNSANVLSEISKRIKEIRDTADEAEPAITRFAANLSALFSRNIGAGDWSDALSGLSQDFSTLRKGGDMLVESLSNIGEALGNDHITNAADTMGSALDAMESTISGALTGGSIGGPIGAAVGAGLGLIQSLTSTALEAEVRYQETLLALEQARVKQQKEYNDLLFEQKMAFEEYTTIFGTDSYGRAKEAIDLAKQSKQDLNNYIQSSDFSGIKVKTGFEKTGLFGWGKGRYTYDNLLDMYPELIDANGELNKELAESIVTSGQLGDADAERLQQAIDYTERYEEAVAEMNDYLTDVFGQLGAELSDALVSAFRNGTDAAKDFTESAAEMLENWIEQMAFSLYVQPKLQEAQKKIQEINASDMSEEEKTAAISKVISGLIADLQASQSEYNNFLQTGQDAAAGEGIDIFQPDEGSRTAEAKGIAQASQDSIDELNGSQTAIKGLLASIDVNVGNIAQQGMTIAEKFEMIVANGQGMQEQVSVANLHLSAIQENTRFCRYLEQMAQDMRMMSTNIERGTREGIKISR